MIIENLLPALALLVVIELVLKGLALWFSARTKQKIWFVILLVLNTAGILPLLYLLFWRKKV